MPPEANTYGRIGSKNPSGIITAETMARGGHSPLVWHQLYWRPYQTAKPMTRTNPSGLKKLARIAYNSSGWLHPTGDARKYEASNTYNYKNGFGHEDWLFRNEWLLDGWRYAFIQGVNKSGRPYQQQPIDLTLYTLEPNKTRRYVATIYDLECLTHDQAVAAVNAFKQNGWLDLMREEVKVAGGNGPALGNIQWVENVLNVRFRVENVDSFPPNSFAPQNDPWLKNRFRYQLYDLDMKYSAQIETSLRRRLGTQVAPTVRSIFRNGTKAVTYTPEHRLMQTKLLAELQKKFGHASVTLEEDFIDVIVRTESEILLYEIKTDLEPRSVIRQALGQILEYAYHPLRKHQLPVRLIIVGRSPLEPEERVYLDILKNQCALPLDYHVVPL